MSKAESHPLIEPFLDALWLERGLSDNTVSSYRSDLEKFALWLDEQGGSLLLVYGPHIGISDEGVLGKLLRPGQGHESAACGSLTMAVEHLHAPTDKIGVYDDDDMEQRTLERRLKPFRDEILAAENPLEAATDVAYRIIHGLILRYVVARKPEFHCEHVALAGGIIINTSPERHDYIDLRHLEVLRVADL